jgi:uncharacterized protein YndB with AHSA1/START domain
MKWAVWLGGSIAALIVVISIIGMMLPRDHIASRSAQLNALPDSIWAVIVDVKDFPRWRSDIVKVEELPTTGGHRSWKESGKHGSITYVAEEEARPTRLVTRIANDNLPFGGSWEYTLAPDGTGTRITIVERGWVSNPIFRFVSHFILGQTATMDTFLRNLGRRFGEGITPMVGTL